MFFYLSAILTGVGIGLTLAGVVAWDSWRRNFVLTIFSERWHYRVCLIAGPILIIAGLFLKQFGI